MISASIGIIASSISQNDTNAQAFFNYYGITNGTIISAVNTLVIGLKNDSLWAKMTAIYPMVGGTNNTVIGNLKTPGTYDLTLGGSPTVNSNGITFNGTTQYTDSGLVPNSVLSLNNTHMSVYSRTTGGFAKVDMGCKQSTTIICDLECMWTDNKFYYQINGSGGTEPGQTIGDGSGLYIGSRQSSTTLQGQRNSTYYTGSIASTSLPTNSIWVGGRNNDFNAAPRNLAWASIGSGLSQTDMSNLYSRVQTFQTTLGRQV